jgi:(2Fe-2S) ferredoxin
VCHGKCRLGPNLFVSPGEVWYCGVTLEDLPTIVSEHVGAGRPVERLLGREPSFLQLDDRLPW